MSRCLNGKSAISEKLTTLRPVLLGGSDGKALFLKIKSHSHLYYESSKKEISQLFPGLEPLNKFDTSAFQQVVQRNT
jgi:hypothetical protein